jgi:hypothetical protein
MSGLSLVDAASKAEEEASTTVNNTYTNTMEPREEEIALASVDKNDYETSASSVEDVGGPRFAVPSPAPIVAEEEVPETTARVKTNKRKSLVDNMMLLSHLSPNQTNGDSASPKGVGEPTASPATPTNEGEQEEKTEKSSPKKNRLTSRSAAFRNVVSGIIFSNLLSDGAEMEYDSSSDDENCKGES